MINAQMKNYDYYIYGEQDANALETGVSCIITSHTEDYYTIQNTKVMYKKFNLKFNEL